MKKQEGGSIKTHVEPGKRDAFSGKAGFVLSCVGSAVGVGNIWLFPSRVSAYGGMTFLIPYFLFVLLIGSTGLIGEIAFGRATVSGPIGAFGRACAIRFDKERTGNALGLIPVFTAFALAIGYSVVLGWILKYTIGSLTGSILSSCADTGDFSSYFDSISRSDGNTLWQTLGVLSVFFALAFGISKGIERANKLMMPLFFLLFAALGVYVATIPGASAGYSYIFTLDPRGLLDPMVWIFALGQAFFSLSIAGSSSLVYGAYVSRDENVPHSAFLIALFDTVAALLAAMIIIPAMAAAGAQLSVSGPGLLFIYLPGVFKTIPGGSFIMAVFFIGILLAALTSLINLFETPVSTIEQIFGLNRRLAVFVVVLPGLVISLFLQATVSGWMDVCSIYLCPLGALLAAVMFFWLCPREYVLAEVNLARRRPLGGWFLLLSRWGYCGVTLAVLALGAALGGIG